MANKPHQLWQRQRISALIIIFCMPLIAILIPALKGATAAEAVIILREPIIKLGVGLILITSCYHAFLGLRVIVIDYIKNPNVKKISLSFISIILLLMALIVILSLLTMC